MLLIYKQLFPICNANAIKNLGSVSHFHISSIYEQTVQENEQPPVRKYKKPVDWLPFPWHRRPRFNIFEQSGDLVKRNPANPDWPKPDFELSDELKTATDEVKKVFTLVSASKAETKESYRRYILQRVQRHPFDFDSFEVKIALKTLQIRSLFEHKDMCKKEIYGGGILLPIFINRRNRYLKMLRQIDSERFEWILKELQLSYKPASMGVKLERYCKKWDLRQLTKEYHNKIIQSKKEAYHKELKKQQEDFLKEKEETLAWIEAEEKALKELS